MGVVRQIGEGGEGLLNVAGIKDAQAIAMVISELLLRRVHRADTDLRHAIDMDISRIRAATQACE